MASARVDWWRVALILQINRKMVVPYNDPDAANSRLENLDDYVAFGAAAVQMSTHVPSTTEKPGPQRSRRKSFLGGLMMKKSTAHGSINEGLGLYKQTELYGFEPEALNFVLTMVSCISFWPSAGSHTCSIGSLL